MLRTETHAKTLAHKKDRQIISIYPEQTHTQEEIKIQIQAKQSYIQNKKKIFKIMENTKILPIIVHFLSVTQISGYPLNN